MELREGAPVTTSTPGARRSHFRYFCCSRARHDHTLGMRRCPLPPALLSPLPSPCSIFVAHAAAAATVTAAGETATLRGTLPRGIRGYRDKGAVRAMLHHRM
jgi:hypothetical protein